MNKCQIDLDFYHVKLDMSSNGVDRTTGTSTPILYLNNTKSTGGDQIKSTQNIPFEIIKRHISKDIRKTNLTAILKSKMLSNLTKLSIPMKNIWNKKIDIDLEDYEIKIVNQLL